MDEGFAPSMSGRGLGSGTTTRARLGWVAVMILSGIAAFTAVGEAGAFKTFWDERSTVALADLIDAENLRVSAARWLLLVSVVTGVLMVAWTYRAYRAVMRSGATRRSWSPGWAVGGWFVPVANLVIPKLVLNEIDRISSPEIGPPPLEDRWRGGSTLALSTWWWALLIAGGVVMLAANALTGSEVEALQAGSLSGFDADRYQSGLWVRVMALGIQTVAAAAGSALIGVLGRRPELQ